MFAAFYSSFWQHPVLLLLLPILFLVLAQRKLIQSRSGFLRSYLCVVLANTLLDATLTADRTVHTLGLPARVASVIAIFFVIAGDFRVFLLAFRLNVERMTLRGWIAVVAISLFGPLAQAGLILEFPRVFAEARLTFLAYELVLFFVLAGALLALGARFSDPLAKEVLLYALATYGLWIAADLVILAGADGGYLLRVMPNLLYYGGYVPFVYFRAKRYGKL
jgi:hypothetical protein